MAAQIPVANNPAANDAAQEKVKADKLREVKAGCDGTWVAHPALIPIAMNVFNEHMKTANQIRKPDGKTSVTARDLLVSSTDLSGAITTAGVKGNLDVGLEYLECWLRGLGCVPLHNLMEDAATAEIARCQIWQWIKHSAVTADGQTITKEWISGLLKEHVQGLRRAQGEAEFNKRKYALAIQLYERMLLSDKLEDFLTSVAYPHITQISGAGQAIKAKL